MCRTRILKDEVEFWSKIASWCNKNISKKKMAELQILFEEEGEVKNFVESKLRDLIEDIKAKRVSLEGFKVQHARKLNKLLDSSSINPELLDDLASQIYGSDERNRNFKE